MLHSYQVMSFTASGNNRFTCSCFKGSSAVVSRKRKLAEVVPERHKHNYCPPSAVRSSCAVCGSGGSRSPRAAHVFPWQIAQLGTGRLSRGQRRDAELWGAVTAARQRARGPAGGSKPLRESGGGRAARSRGGGSWVGPTVRPLTALGRASRLAAAGVPRRPAAVRSPCTKGAGRWRPCPLAPPPSAAALGTACGRRRWAGVSRPRAGGPGLPVCRRELSCGFTSPPLVHLRQGSGLRVFVVSSKPSATLGCIANEHSLRTRSKQRCGARAPARTWQPSCKSSRPVPSRQRPPFAHKHLSEQRPAVPCFPLLPPPFPRPGPFSLSISSR